MLVQCTGCRTKYRISEDRIPSSGVKVRCPKCRVIFDVKREAAKEPETLAERLFGREAVRRPLGGESSAQESYEKPPAGPAPSIAAAETPRNTEEAAQPSEAAAQAAETPVTSEAAPSEPAEGMASPEPAEAGTSFHAEEPREEEAREDVRDVRAEAAGVEKSLPGPSPQVPPETPKTRVPEEDPRTLARALVSDILFYNREKRDKGLAEGKILAYLGKEIARSWELYKERVGMEKAFSGDHFREAVNDILAEGREIL